MKMKVEKLFIYPIKSCGGLSVPELQIGESGPQIVAGSSFIGDRQWMFVDSDGKFLTQRSLQKMALLQPAINRDRFFLEVEGKSFEIPLDLKNPRRMQVSVWGKEIDAALVEGPLSEAVSQFLGLPVQLVQFDSRSDREILVKGKGQNAQTRFTDSQAYLVVTRESLKDLNAKLEHPIDERRFRGNIFLSGASKPFAEDDWQVLSNDAVDFESTKACARCKVITVDPDTGKIPTSEPLVALSQYRKKETAVYFGQYFLSRSYGETLRVGDWLQA